MSETKYTICLYDAEFEHPTWVESVPMHGVPVAIVKWTECQADAAKLTIADVQRAFSLLEGEFDFARIIVARYSQSDFILSVAGSTVTNIHMAHNRVCYGEKANKSGRDEVLQVTNLVVDMDSESRRVTALLIASS